MAETKDSIACVELPNHGHLHYSHYYNYLVIVVLSLKSVFYKSHCVIYIQE